MPSTNATHSAPATDLPRSSGVVESRIDAPHVLGDGPPRAAQTSSLEPDLGVDATAVETLALVQAQAQQLSSHLSERAQDLDAREAKLQAQMATFDNDVRGTRMALAERAAALEERERLLDEQSARAVQLEAAIARQTADQAQQWQRQEDEYAARKGQLNVVARRLVQQRLAHQKAMDRLRAARRRFDRDMRLVRQQIDTRRSASLALAAMLLDGMAQHRAALEIQEQQLAQREETLFARANERAAELAARLETIAVREQRLTASEKLLAEQQAECAALRERLNAQQQELQSTRRAAETESQAQRAEAELVIKQQQLAVERRSQEVDSRRLSLEQLQSDVRQMHRESLEMRLATEELAAQLAGTAPPAAVTSAIGRLRGKLADHFRLASADLAQQRQELLQMQSQLSQQHERLSTQKADLQQWLERRQDEIEQQAARLVCREQELDWQQEQLESIQSRWQDERQHYQEQLRGLLQELQRKESLAA
jgi:hypothetical protein